MDQIKEIKIEELHFPENVRTRPTMYIGDLDNADTCLREIVDNSIDEVFSKDSPCDTIHIWSTDKFHIVADNGRGIPCTKSTINEEMTMAVQSVTSLHAGSKFKKSEAAIGQNGVGSSVVSALSFKYLIFLKLTEQKLSLTTDKVKSLFKESGLNVSEAYYRIELHQGVLFSESIVTKDLIESELEVSIADDLMTIVAFDPDTTKYESRSAKFPPTLKFLKYIMTDRGKEVKVYQNGKEYTKSFDPFKNNFGVNIVSDWIETPLNKEVRFLCSLEVDTEEFSPMETIGSVNGLQCNTGYHIRLADDALLTALNRIFGHDLKGYGLWGIRRSIVCLAPEPTFSSQTKERCSGIPGINYTHTEPLIQKYIQVIKDNRELFEAHINRVLEYIRANAKLSTIDLIKSKVPILAENSKAAAKLPSSVADCTTTKRENAELFIVEGRSAGGTLLQARDRNIHAVLFLRGKPMNTTGRSVEEMLDNEESRSLVAAIGTGVDDYFNLSQIRYGKIILLADADSDGANINSIVLGLFCKHMKYLIDEGMVYVGLMPLYEQNGTFFYPGDTPPDPSKGHVTRFKGLGEMQASQLKKCALNPNIRKLVRITSDNLNHGIRILTLTSARKEILVEDGNIVTDKQLTYNDL